MSASRPSRCLVTSASPRNVATAAAISAVCTPSDSPRPAATPPATAIAAPRPTTPHARNACGSGRLGLTVVALAQHGRDVHVPRDGELEAAGLVAGQRRAPAARLSRDVVAIAR